MTPLLSPKDQAARDAIRSSAPRYATNHELLNLELRLELIILMRLEQIESNIMATVKDAIKAFQTAVQASFDKLTSDLDAIKTEIADLNTAIQNLNNSPGELGAEDQATLDGIAAQSAALVTKADALTVQPPPAPPAVP